MWPFSKSSNQWALPSCCPRSKCSALPGLRVPRFDTKTTGEWTSTHAWHVGEISSSHAFAHLLELNARSDPWACRSSRFDLVHNTQSARPEGRPKQERCFLRLAGLLDATRYVLICRVWARIHRSQAQARSGKASGRETVTCRLVAVTQALSLRVPVELLPIGNYRLIPIIKWNLHLRGCTFLFSRHPVGSLQMT